MNQSTSTATCQYIGHVNDGNDMAAVSFCDNHIRGIFMLHKGAVLPILFACSRLLFAYYYRVIEYWTIEPATAMAGMHRQTEGTIGDHIIFKASASLTSSPSLSPLDSNHHTCGVTADFASSWNMFYPSKSKTSEHGHGSDAQEGSLKQQSTSTVFVYFVLVNYFLRVKQKGASTALTSSAAIVNMVDALYLAASFDPPVRVTLIGQVSFTDADPYFVTLLDNGEVSTPSLLSSLALWVANTGSLPLFDNCHLISGYDFEASAVGLAPLGTMCSADNSVAVSQGLGLTTAQSAVTMGHEMGHNLGMIHDDGSTGCPVSGYLMASVLDQSVVTAQQFSPCSRTGFETWFATNVPLCLLNTPTSHWSTGTCGDGVVNSDEACDCGASDCSSTSDPCCDGSTCQLRSSSSVVCSNSQACCSNCQIVTASSQKICRSATDSVCDVVEVCSGASASCPVNAYRTAGTLCTDSLGGSGVCYAGECYSQRSTCHDIDSNLVSCTPLSSSSLYTLTCQQMYCANSTGTCQAVAVNVSSVSSSFVDDGVPCASGSQCRAGRCMASAKLDINSVYVTDDTTTYITSSSNIGTILQIVIVVAIIGGLLLILLGYRRYKKRQRNTPEVRQQQAIDLQQQRLQQISDAQKSGLPPPSLPSNPAAARPSSSSNSRNNNNNGHRNNNRTNNNGTNNINTGPNGRPTGTFATISIAGSHGAPSSGGTLALPPSSNPANMDSVRVALAP
jgi:type II secretory pathway pseudopilin PulG